MSSGARRSGSLSSVGGELLLEPVVCVWLVVERRNLAIACRAVESDRLGQAVIRFKPKHAGAAVACESLEFGQESSSKTQAASRWRDPHPFELCGAAAVELQRAAADGRAVQRRNGEQPGG